MVDEDYIVSFLERQYDSFSSLFTDHDFFSVDVSRLHSFPDFSLISLQMVGNFLDY